MKSRKKNTRHRGTHTHGGGAKKKGRGKGHRGGIGNAGTGKRGDQKKDMVRKPFGKRKTLRRKPTIELKTINLRDVINKAKGKKEIEFEGYKILGVGEIKEKIEIKATAASKSAIDKVKKAGGDIIVKESAEKKD